MGRSGPQRRPSLEVVREGNPGKRSAEDLEQGVSLDPSAPEEPDWTEWFCGETNPVETSTAIETAQREWRAIVPVLDAKGLLATVDRTVLADHCVTAARIVLCERDIDRFGIWVAGERGAQKNPSVTAANQYRTHLRYTLRELGLTPAARDAMRGRGGGDGDDQSPFDV